MTDAYPTGLGVKYYLWIDGKQSGPYEPADIRVLINSGKIVPATLAHPEGATGDWLPISSYPQILEIKNPAPVLPPAKPIAAPKSTLPPIDESIVAILLRIVALLSLVGSPIIGVCVGSNDETAGWLVCVSGIVSGLMLVGFAQVIQYTFETSQRLNRLEIIIQRAIEKTPSSE